MPKRNQLKVRWIEQDVFQFLRAAEKAGRAIRLDHSRSAIVHKDEKRHSATLLRGYRELHMRAFKLVIASDGMLATFSCSHHVSDVILSETISDGAGGCAAIGTTASPVRAGARSPVFSDDSGDGIFQGRVAGNEPRNEAGPD